ncbi:hypothetical protein MT390_16345 [Vibrio sp. 2-Bac 85]
MKKSKIMLSSIIALSLTACGGGGGDSKNGSSGGGESDKAITSYVNGEFKSMTENNINLSRYIDNTSFNSGLNSCTKGSDKYFESYTDSGEVGTIVFASGNVPENDYKYAATVVEDKISEVLEKLNLSAYDYLEYKGSLSPKDLSYLNYIISNEIDSLSYDDPDLEVDEEDYNKKRQEYALKQMKDNHGSVYELLLSYYSELMSDEEANKLIYLAVTDRYDEDTGEIYILSSVLRTVLLSNSQKTAKLADEYIESEYEYEYHPEKIVVCIDPNRSNGSWGEGNLDGIIFGSNTSAGRNDSQQVIKHELVHHLQSVLTGDNIDLERWFSEGMASSIANQSIKEGSVINVTNVINDMEEDGRSLYPEYGYAYREFESKYLLGNVSELLLSIRENYTDDDSGGFTYYKKFENAFNESVGYVTSLYEFKNELGGFDCSVYSPVQFQNSWGFDEEKYGLLIPYDSNNDETLSCRGIY